MTFMKQQCSPGFKGHENFDWMFLPSGKKGRAEVRGVVLGFFVLASHVKVGCWGDQGAYSWKIKEFWRFDGMCKLLSLRWHFFNLSHRLALWPGTGCSCLLRISFLHCISLSKLLSTVTGLRIWTMSLKVKEKTRMPERRGSQGKIKNVGDLCASLQVEQVPLPEERR